MLSDTEDVKPSLSPSSSIGSQELCIPPLVHSNVLLPLVLKHLRGDDDRTGPSSIRTSKTYAAAWEESSRRWRSAFDVWRKIVDCDALFLALLLHSGCLWSVDYDCLFDSFQCLLAEEVRRSKRGPSHAGERFSPEVEMATWGGAMSALRCDYPFDTWALRVIHFLHLVEIFELDSEEEHVASETRGSSATRSFGSSESRKRDTHEVMETRSKDALKGMKPNAAGKNFHDSEEFFPPSCWSALDCEYDSTPTSQRAGEGGRGGESSEGPQWWGLTAFSSNEPAVQRTARDLVDEWFHLMAHPSLSGTKEEVACGSGSAQRMEDRKNCGNRDLWLASAIKFAVFVDGVESSFIENVSVTAIAARQGMDWATSMVEILNRSIPSTFLCLLEQEVVPMREKTGSDAPYAAKPSSCEVPLCLPPLSLLVPFHLFGKGSVVSALSSPRMRSTWDSLQACLSGPSTGVSARVSQLSFSTLRHPRAKRVSFSGYRSVRQGLKSKESTVVKKRVSAAEEEQEMKELIGNERAKGIWMEGLTFASNGFIVQHPLKFERASKEVGNAGECGLGLRFHRPAAPTAPRASLDSVRYTSGKRVPLSSAQQSHARGSASVSRAAQEWWSVPAAEIPMLRLERAAGSMSAHRGQDRDALAHQDDDAMIAQGSLIPRVLLLKPIMNKRKEFGDSTSPAAGVKKKRRGDGGLSPCSLVFPYLLLYQEVSCGYRSTDRKIDWFKKQHGVEVETAGASRAERSQARRSSLAFSLYRRGTTAGTSSSSAGSVEDLAAWVQCESQDPLLHLVHALFRVARRLLSLRGIAVQKVEKSSESPRFYGKQHPLSASTAASTTFQWGSFENEDAELVGLSLISSSFALLATVLATAGGLIRGMFQGNSVRNSSNGSPFRLTTASPTLLSQMTAFLTDVCCVVPSLSHSVSQIRLRALFRGALFGLALHTHPHLDGMLVAVGWVARLVRRDGVAAAQRCRAKAEVPSAVEDGFHDFSWIRLLSSVVASPNGVTERKVSEESDSDENWLSYCLPPTFLKLLSKAKRECGILIEESSERSGEKSSIANAAPMNPSSSRIRLKLFQPVSSDRPSLSAQGADVAEIGSRKELVAEVASAPRKEDGFQSIPFFPSEAVVRYYLQPPLVELGD